MEGLCDLAVQSGDVFALKTYFILTKNNLFYIRVLHDLSSEAQFPVSCLARKFMA